MRAFHGDPATVRLSFKAHNYSFGCGLRLATRDGLLKFEALTCFDAEVAWNMHHPHGEGLRPEVDGQGWGGVGYGVVSLGKEGGREWLWK